MMDSFLREVVIDSFEFGAEISLLAFDVFNQWNSISLHFYQYAVNLEEEVVLEIELFGSQKRVGNELAELAFASLGGEIAFVLVVFGPRVVELVNIHVSHDLRSVNHRLVVRRPEQIGHRAVRLRSYDEFDDIVEHM